MLATRSVKPMHKRKGRETGAAATLCFVTKDSISPTNAAQSTAEEVFRYVYIGGNKGLYVVARNFFLLLLNCSAWPCLGPA